MTPITIYQQADLLIGQIRRIDHILKDPIDTLATVTRAVSRDERYVPAWISRNRRGVPSLLAHALVASTLQRVHRLRRRFEKFDEFGIDDALVHGLADGLRSEERR